MKKKTYGKMRKSHINSISLHRRARRTRRTRRTRRGGGWFFPSKNPPPTRSSLQSGLPPRPQQQTVPPLSGFTILRKPIDAITKPEFDYLKEWNPTQGIDYVTDLEKQNLVKEIQDKKIAWGINNARRRWLQQEERETQAAIDAVDKYIRENQNTSPSVIYNEPSGVGPSGVGWMGWDANDEAKFKRRQRRDNGVSAIDWRGDVTSQHWH